MTARQIYVWTHRVLGFTFGGFFALLGISGALLVYRSNVDAFLDPAPYRVSGSTITVGPDAAVAIARRASDNGRLVQLDVPHATGWPGGAVYVADFKHQVGSTLAYVDPHDGRILAQRRGKPAVTSAIKSFHTELLLGGAGKAIVAVLGGAFILTTAGGLLVWPGWRNLRNGLSISRTASAWRIGYDLHKILGITSATFFLVFAATGILLVNKSATRAAFAIKPSRPPRVPAHSADARPLALSGLLAAAHGAFPQSTARSINLPALAHRPVVVYLIGPGDIDQIDGNERVYLDPITGAVLGRVDAMRDPAGFTDIVYALHTCRLWANGLPRAGAVVLGLVPVVLLGLATTTWALRQSARARPKGAPLAH
ncbi:MAG TPA: PepSY-associated TM helix domain-containing protein [Candidatus Cybelea sp.]|jgi:uncharacterized iron-regulated membrane protein|nr:PepSY-associated TM helix domain-containing protein [Candidatus Cybelea sp.]